MLYNFLNASLQLSLDFCHFLRSFGIIKCFCKGDSCAEYVQNARCAGWKAVNSRITKRICSKENLSNAFTGNQFDS